MARKHDKRRVTEMVAPPPPASPASTVIQYHLQGKGAATFEFRSALPDGVKAELIRRMRTAADPLEEVRRVALETVQGVVCTIPKPDRSGFNRYEVSLTDLYSVRRAG